MKYNSHSGIKHQEAPMNKAGKYIQSFFWGKTMKLLKEVKEDFKKCRPIFSQVGGYSVSVLYKLVYKF